MKVMSDTFINCHDISHSSFIIYLISINLTFYYFCDPINPFIRGIGAKPFPLISVVIKPAVTVLVEIVHECPDFVN